MGVRFVTGLALLVTLAAQVTPASAQQKPAATEGVLPDYDRRESLAPANATASVQSASARLRGSRSDIIIKSNPHTGGLRTAFSPRRPLTGPSRGEPRGIGRAFLVRHAEALGLEPSDVRTLVPDRQYVTGTTGVQHLFWTQVVDGVPVFDSMVAVHVAADGAVLRVHSNAASARDRQARLIVDAADALRRAVADVRADALVDTTLTRAPEGANRSARFARGSFAKDVDISLVWLAVQGRLRLAWSVLLEPEGLPQAYDVVVDAESGDVLLRRNRVKYADGRGRVVQSSVTAAADPRRPDPQPFGSDGTPAGCPPVTNHLVQDLTSAFRDSAWTLGNTGRLAGNATEVFRRTSGAQAALGTFDGAAWWFDFPFNTADAAETTLFFTTNFAHDFFYDLGFDEAAGNYQVDNFARGGAGNDPVRALARANGRNNATWQPAADGQSPTMSMFLWDGAGCWGEDVDGDGLPDLDGDLDSDIVIHEYHHGVSLRLNTAFTGPEAGAIGEGGGDFFAYSVNGDTILADYSRPGGIRRVNAKTYADWTCLFGLFCEVHDNGEIWANVLWDVRERFRRDAVNGSAAAAIDESHRVYIDGLKLSPPAPSMLDLRDAMLQADAIRNPDGDRSGNFCRIWESFAARGMGAAAVDSSQDPLRNVVADYSVPAGCTAPPPPPTVSIVALDATAHEAGTSPATLRVERTGATTSALEVSFGLGGTAGSSDYVPVGSSVTIPEGTSSAVLTITPVDDAIVEANESLMVTLRPAGAYIVGTPSAATVTIVSDDVAPDLQVSALSAPASAAAGSPIAVSDTTLNAGDGPAPESRTAFYLSTNFSVDASDVTLGARTVPALAPGGASAQTTTVTIPDGVGAGTYYVLAQADGDLAIAERSEFNNLRSAMLRLGPDLVVTALSAPTIAAPGASIGVSDTTVNQGAAGAAATSTRYYLSSNFTYDAGDVPLPGERAVPALAAGSSSSGTAAVTVPAGTPTGTYYLLARADAGEAVTEAQETNNTRWAQLQVGGDLVVSAVSGPARAAAGASIVVNDTTRNQGAAGVGASSTMFYVSANFSLDASDIRIGSRPVPALAAGASHAASTAVTLPADLPAGTWNVLAHADGESEVVETQESNNIRAFSLQVGPDLRVTSFSAPSTGTAGSSLTVTDTVTNSGAAAAGASRVRYYLSINSRFETTDLVLAEARAVPALAPAAASAGSTTLSLPSTLAAGRYYLFAVADGDGAVPESSEINNTAIRIIDIGS